MSDVMVIALAILSIGFILALIKEIFGMMARGFIRAVGKVFHGIVFAVVWVVSTVIKIIVAPFCVLWGFVSELL